MEVDCKKEVINVCLDHFIEKGLFETSTRSLSSELKLQSGGLYYYFSNQDEAVILCTEASTIRLESDLITPALRDIGNSDDEVSSTRANEIVSTMRLLASACTSKHYKDDVKPVLDRLAERYEHYAELVAKKLNCGLGEIEPYVFMTITAVANYMIFAEDGISAPQMKLVKRAINNIIARQTLDERGRKKNDCYNNK